MRYKCVTSMNKAYYDKVGRRMIESFIERWPEDIILDVYTEDESLNDSRVNIIDLYQVEPECKAFVERHKDRPDQQNVLELHKGAVRFSYKTFSILNAGSQHDTDYLIWIDADTYTHTNVTYEFLDTITDKNRYLTYLGRDNNYSECGFVIYNMNIPAHASFFDTWRYLYESDELFNLDQWHDSFVFDRIRNIYEDQGIIENINLSPWGKNYDHVFINSVLGDYMDHMKGPRKNRGKSNLDDLLFNKTNTYWS